MNIIHKQDAGRHVLFNDDISMIFNEAARPVDSYLELKLDGRMSCMVFAPKMTQVLEELHELGIPVIDKREVVA